MDRIEPDLTGDKRSTMARFSDHHGPPLWEGRRGSLSVNWHFHSAAEEELLERCSAVCARSRIAERGEDHNDPSLQSLL